MCVVVCFVFGKTMTVPENLYNSPPSNCRGGMLDSASALDVVAKVMHVGELQM